MNVITFKKVWGHMEEPGENGDGFNVVFAKEAEYLEISIDSDSEGDGYSRP